jgi:hypothetical protein
MNSSSITVSVFLKNLSNNIIYSLLLFSTIPVTDFIVSSVAFGLMIYIDQTVNNTNIILRAILNILSGLSNDASVKG